MDQVGLGPTGLVGYGHLNALTQETFRNLVQLHSRDATPTPRRLAGPSARAPLMLAGVTLAARTTGRGTASALPSQASACWPARHLAQAAEAKESRRGARKDLRSGPNSPSFSLDLDVRASSGSEGFSQAW